MRRLLAVFAAAMMMLTMLAAPAGAEERVRRERPPKVQLCHFTDSERNPVRIISVRERRAERLIARGDLYFVMRTDPKTG